MTRPFPRPLHLSHADQSPASGRAVGPTAGHALRPSPRSSRAPVFDDHDRIEAIRALNHQPTRRARVFPNDVFGDPGWAILLHLFENALTGKACTIRSCQKASGASMDTALRYIRYFENAGYVARAVAEDDTPRNGVGVTDAAIAKLEQYMADAARR